MRKKSFLPISGERLWRGITKSLIVTLWLLTALLLISAVKYPAYAAMGAMLGLLAYAVTAQTRKEVSDAQ